MVGRETNIDHRKVNRHMGEEKGPRGGIVCVFVIFDRYDREMNGQSILILGFSVSKHTDIYTHQSYCPLYNRHFHLNCLATHTKR